MDDLQLEMVLFRAKQFAGKLVVPLQQYDEAVAQKLLASARDLMDADGWRVTWGPHNATNVMFEHEAPPLDDKSGVRVAVPRIRVAPY